MRKKKGDSQKIGKAKGGQSELASLSICQRGVVCANSTYIQQLGDPNANHDGGDQYTGLDRFGRVIDQNWINTLVNQSYDRFQYVYDQDSEVVARNNMIVPSLNESYQYNNLGELTSFQRGSHTQTWTPDALGNFSSVITDGSTQYRTVNQQNQYTSISTNNWIIG